MWLKFDRLVVVGIFFGGSLDRMIDVSGMKNIVIGMFCSSVGSMRF